MKFEDYFNSIDSADVKEETDGFESFFNQIDVDKGKVPKQATPKQKETNRAAGTRMQTIFEKVSNGTIKDVLPQTEPESNTGFKRPVGVVNNLKYAGEEALKSFLRPFKFVDRASASLATALAPKGKMFVGSKKLFGDLNYIDGPTPYEKAKALQETKGNGGSSDKVADFVGEAGSYFVPIGGAGAGSLYRGAGALVDRYGTKLGNGLGARAGREAAKEGIVGAPLAVQQGMAQDGFENVGMDALEGAGMGAAGGAAGSLIGKGVKSGVSAIRERAAFKQAIDDFMTRTNSPQANPSGVAAVPDYSQVSLAKNNRGMRYTASDEIASPSIFPKERIVQQAGTGNLSKTSDEFASSLIPKVKTQQIPEGVQGMTKGDRSSRLRQIIQSVDQGPVYDNAELTGKQAMSAQPIPFRPENPNANVKKPITRQKLMGNVRKRFNITVRTGRLGVSDPDVLGYYKVKPEVVRSRSHGDIQVISHEVGHHLDKKLQLQDPRFDGELIPLGRQTSGQGYTVDQIRMEGIAEYFRLLLTDGATAKQAAPNFSTFFEGKLDKKLIKALEATQKDVATWIDQGPAMQFRGQVNRTGKDASSGVAAKVDAAYTSFIDKLHPLSDAEKAINKYVTGEAKLNDASESLYKKARLFAGAPKKAQIVLQELKAILKPLDKFGISLKDLGDYAAARHALELENLKIESGFTRNQIQEVITKFNTPEMQTVHRKLMAYNNSLLDMLVKGEVISQEAVDAMRKKYPNYVPFYRYFDEDVSSGFGGKGFADLTNPVKRLKGSTRDIIDPLESMIKNTFAVVNAVEKNKVGLELARLSKKEGAGAFVEKLDGSGKVPKEQIVTVFENGERVQYQLEPELYRAINELDKEPSIKLVNFLSHPSSWLRAGATLTPEFILRNPIRDQFQAFVVSNFGYNPIIDFPVGMFHVLGRTKMYKQWASEGGGYGNVLSMDRDLLREQLKTLRNESNPWARATLAIVNPKDWLKLLRIMGEFSEEATKVGEFRSGIRKGKTPEEAAFQSRDLMDFGRVGNNIKQVNRMVTFLNANIQGKDRLARAFANNPVRTTVRALTAVTMPAVGIYIWNKYNSSEEQRKTLDNAPQWLRDTFFLVSIPGTDVVARIPKPFDMAPVFANLPENIMRWMDDNDPQGAGQFAKDAAFDMLKIPFMFTALTPLIENFTNKSFFTGGPIVPRRDQDLLPEDQYGVNTSLTARTVGKLTGTSPYKVDNLVRGYGAGLGRYTTAGTDKVLEKAGVGKMPPQEEKKISELPIINAFTVDSTGGGKAMDDFYKRLDDLVKREKSNEKNQVVDKEVKAVSDGMERASRSISEKRKKYREIQGSFTMSPAEKRKKLDELNDIMNNIAKESVDKYKVLDKR